MASSGFAETPEDGYFAVIFTSRHSTDTEGYGQMATRMLELAPEQPGFLGIERARGEDGLALAVSYWADEESIAAWKRHAEHREAQRLGVTQWYDQYEVRIARVERSYGRGRGARSR